jgi:hypothetical protein
MPRCCCCTRPVTRKYKRVCLNWVILHTYMCTKIRKTVMPMCARAPRCSQNIMFSWPGTHSCRQQLTNQIHKNCCQIKCTFTTSVTIHEEAVLKGVPQKMCFAYVCVG